MIVATEFIEAARALRFNYYTGVPCSFLTPFINDVINDPTLEYIASVNEGDAVATAAGLAIGGQRAVVMMQNSGLGNAVSPLTSLSYVFQIPFLIITTHRGQAGLEDEPQHELMGQITTALFDSMRIPWEVFPTQGKDIMPALQRADDYMQGHRRPYALIMEKGTVAPQTLLQHSVVDILNRTTGIRTPLQSSPAKINRNTALKRIIEQSSEDNTVLIATTGFTGRELFATADRHNHLYMVGSMGCATSLGLGIALARPDLKIIVIDGDGAALMRMGNFATIGSYACKNLVHILLDNGVHDSTGGQATVANNVDFSKIAQACGYAVSLVGNDVAVLDELFKLESSDGALFCHVKIVAGTLGKLPRPTLSPSEVLTRLMQHINTHF